MTNVILTECCKSKWFPNFDVCGWMQVLDECMSGWILHVMMVNECKFWISYLLPCTCLATLKLPHTITSSAQAWLPNVWHPREHHPCFSRKAATAFLASALAKSWKANADCNMSSAYNAYLYACTCMCVNTVSWMHQLGLACVWQSHTDPLLLSLCRWVLDLLLDHAQCLGLLGCSMPCSAVDILRVHNHFTLGCLINDTWSYTIC